MTHSPGAPASDSARAKMDAAVKLAIADAEQRAAQSIQIHRKLAGRDARLKTILEGNSNVID